MESHRYDNGITEIGEFQHRQMVCGVRYDDRMEQVGAFTEKALMLGYRIYEHGMDAGRYARTGHLLDGIRFFPDGQIAEGHYLQDSLREGSIRKTNADVYQGHFDSEGLLTGFGRIDFGDEDNLGRLTEEGWYESGWLNNTHEEQVSWRQYRDGCREEGAYRDNLLHGWGKTECPTGESHIGEHFFGMLRTGEIHLPDGTKISKNLTNGRSWGFPTITGPEGTVRMGFVTGNKHAILLSKMEAIQLSLAILLALITVPLIRRVLNPAPADQVPPNQPQADQQPPNQRPVDQPPRLPQELLQLFRLLHEIGQMDQLARQNQLNNEHADNEPALQRQQPVDPPVEAVAVDPYSTATAIREVEEVLQTVYPDYDHHSIDDEQANAQLGAGFSVAMFELAKLAKEIINNDLSIENQQCYNRFFIKLFRSLKADNDDAYGNTQFRVSRLKQLRDSNIAVGGFLDRSKSEFEENHAIGEDYRKDPGFIRLRTLRDQLNVMIQCLETAPQD